jgi:hypothetical protein
MYLAKLDKELALMNVEASLGQHGGDRVEKILGLGVGSVPAYDTTG